MIILWYDLDYLRSIVVLEIRSDAIGAADFVWIGIGLERKWFSGFQKESRVAVDCEFVYEQCAD